MSSTSASPYELLQGGTLWLTGFSGAGKSTLSQAVHERLQGMLGDFASNGRSRRVFILDGDVVRRGLNKDLRFSREDRAENIRRIGEVAKILTASGVLCIVAFISPYQVDRDLVRQSHKQENIPFIECHVAASIDVCKQRDVKGLYAKAISGEIENFTGISDPYDVPPNPELKIDTGSKPLNECVDEAIEALLKHNILRPTNIEVSSEKLSVLSHQSFPVDQLLQLKSHSQVVEILNMNDILRSGQIGLSNEQRDSQYKPLIIVGPSGVGKSTLINHLQERHYGQFQFSISYTTRNPRQGEKHGVNYFYVSKFEFEEMISRDEFVEWKNVHGNFYGTSKTQIRETQANKKIPLLDIDIQGTETFLESFPESNSLFIFPPSTSVLEQRLRGRGTDKEEDIQKRLANSRKEIARGLDQDDPKSLIGYRLVNDDLETSKPAFLRIVEGLYYQELPEAQLDLPVHPEDEVENKEVVNKVREIIQEVQDQVEENIGEGKEQEPEKVEQSSSGDSSMGAALVLTAVASFALGFILSRKR